MELLEKAIWKPLLELFVILMARAPEWVVRECRRRAAIKAVGVFWRTYLKRTAISVSAERRLCRAIRDIADRGPRGPEVTAEHLPDLNARLRSTSDAEGSCFASIESATAFGLVDRMCRQLGLECLHDQGETPADRALEPRTAAEPTNAIVLGGPRYNGMALSVLRHLRVPPPVIWSGYTLLAEMGRTGILNATDAKPDWQRDCSSRVGRNFAFIARVPMSNTEPESRPVALLIEGAHARETLWATRAVMERDFWQYLSRHEKLRELWSHEQKRKRKATTSGFCIVLEIGEPDKPGADDFGHPTVIMAFRLLADHWDPVQWPS